MRTLPYAWYTDPDVLVESVQRGVAAGALEAGELLLPAESLIAAFQRWVSDALAREPQLPGA